MIKDSLTTYVSGYNDHVFGLAIDSAMSAYDIVFCY